MASCIKFTSEEMKRNLIAMLSGDVKKIEDLIHFSHNKPIPIASASWGGEIIIIDSYLFSYVLYDALLFDNDDTDYRGRNIPEMLDMHKRLCGEMKHPDYSKIPFVSYNDWDYFYDEEDIAELKEDGATPYFLNRCNLISDDKDCHYGYLEIAFLLCHLDSEWCDQWELYGLTKWEKDINSLEDEDLEIISFAMFNAAASQRMLYIIDKYITDEARAKGEELMREYNAYYPILRHKPDELIDEIKQ